MGYLRQEESIVPDTRKMLLSFWVRIPAGTNDIVGGSYVLEWGEAELMTSAFGGDDYQPVTNYIFINSFQPGFGIEVSIGGRKFNQNMYSPNSDTLNYSWNVRRELRYTAGTVVPDVWNHVLVSVDTSIESEVIGNWNTNTFVKSTDIVSANRLWLYHNNVDRSPTSNTGVLEEIFGFDFVNKPTPSGWILPSSHAVLNQTSDGAIIYDNRIYWGRPASGSPSLPRHTVGYYSQTGLDQFMGRCIVAGWDMAFEGFEFGIPNQAYYVPNNYPVDIAEFKLWTGVAPDIGDQATRRLFIDATNKPVDPVASISAFGTPRYHLRRNKRKSIRFEDNSGSGGSLVKVGTVSDFTPGPGG